MLANLRIKVVKGKGKVFSFPSHEGIHGEQEYSSTHSRLPY